MADVIRNVTLRFKVEGDKAAADAAAAVEKAVEKTGETAKKTTAPGGGITSLNDSLRQTTDRFNKATSAVEGIMSSLARIGGAVALAVAAFTAIKTAAELLNDALTAGRERFETLTEEAVKAKTGLRDLSTQMDAYARSIGLANPKLLTFVQRQAALRALQRGGGSQNFEVADAELEAATTELNQIRDQISAEQARGGLFGGMVDALRVKEKEALDRYNVANRKALSFQARADREARDAAAVAALVADGGAGVDETAGTPAPVRRSGGGGRAVSAAPATVPFWAANAAGMLSDAQATANRVGIEGTLGAGGAAVGGASAQALSGITKAAEDAARAFDETQASLAGGIFDVERLAALEDQAAATFETFGRGLAQSTAAAIAYGGSMRKVANEALKGLAIQAAGEALFQTAKGLALLALGRVDAAALAFDSAALFGVIAAGGALGTAATGGLRSGGGGGASRGASRAPSRDDFNDRGNGGGDGGVNNITVVIGGKAINDSVVAYSRGAAGSRSQPRVAVVQG